MQSQHIAEVLAGRPVLGFFEVHAENYMVDGGPSLRLLDAIRSAYPLSLHGVALSIGGEQPPDAHHLDRLARLIDRFEPAEFSEHLAWSGHDGVFLNDLLPVCYDRQTLARVCEHIDRVQSRLGRRMLLENPATYLEFAASTMPEADFLGEVLRRTGCGLLLDITNAYVSCVNHGRDVSTYIGSLPLGAVGEIHLAGYSRQADAAGAPLLIDSHGAAVDEIVWLLYEAVLTRLPRTPVLIERDNEVPALPILISEARHAERLMHVANQAVPAFAPMEASR